MAKPYSGMCDMICNCETFVDIVVRASRVAYICCHVSRWRVNASSSGRRDPSTIRAAVGRACRSAANEAAATSDVDATLVACIDICEWLGARTPSRTRLRQLQQCCSSAATDGRSMIEVAFIVLEDCDILDDATRAAVASAGAQVRCCCGGLMQSAQRSDAIADGVECMLCTSQNCGDDDIVWRCLESSPIHPLGGYVLCGQCRWHLQETRLAMAAAADGGVIAHGEVVLHAATAELNRLVLVYPDVRAPQHPLLARYHTSLSSIAAARVPSWDEYCTVGVSDLVSRVQRSTDILHELTRVGDTFQDEAHRNSHTELVQRDCTRALQSLRCSHRHLSQCTSIASAHGLQPRLRVSSEHVFVQQLVDQITQELEVDHMCPRIISVCDDGISATFCHIDKPPTNVHLQLAHHDFYLCFTASLIQTYQDTLAAALTRIARCLTRDDVESVLSAVHQLSEYASGDDLCAVCQDSVHKSGEPSCSITTCGHAFHDTCIRHWLLGYSAQCPVCNGAVLGTRALG